MGLPHKQSDLQMLGNERAAVKLVYCLSRCETLSPLNGETYGTERQTHLG